MTNEEMQKTMQFILEQQAQFVVDIQKLQESQTQTNDLLTRLAAVTVRGFEETNAKIDALVDSQIRLTEAQTRNEEAITDINAKINALVDSNVRLSEGQERLSEKLERLSESHERLSESEARLSEKMERLSESQAKTDERLRHLMEAADRYFSEGRNGK